MPLRLHPSPLPPLFFLHRRTFSTTRRFHASDVESQSYYEVLQLPYTATQPEIKKQFYTLSKAHHPDLHPNDPTASSRFHRLSEAYHILSTPEKRREYDRQLGRSTISPSSPSKAPSKGSFSSHTGPAGSRPASGLSRRRAQFRGPPPSFYAQGGWGLHAGKRSAAAAAGHAANSQPHNAKNDENRDGNGSAAVSAQETGSEHGWAHWNRAAHLRTHESIDARFEVRRARAAEQRMHAVEEERKARMMDTLMRSLVMTGLMGAIFAIGATIVSYGGPGTVNMRRDNDGG